MKTNIGNSANTNGTSTTIVSEDAPIEKTDMAKVNYYLSRPGLLVDQLPKSRKEELAEHVGRRGLNRGMANPRLNKSR